MGLSLTAVVFLLLPEHRERVAGEWRPLLTGIAWTGGLTAVAAGSFVGELKKTPWRRPLQVAMLLALVVVLWRYWP